MYDVIIIGAGASGLTTGLYTARANLKTLIIEKGIFGGQMMSTAEIENYSGFGSISGQMLSQYMYNQTINQGAKYMYGDVKGIEKTNGIFYVDLGDEVIEAKSVVIATGVEHRKLGVKGEEELSGRGVSYCAVCDGAFFKNKHVVVIGGGDSALEEANYLTQFVDKVTLVHRRDKFKGQAILQKRVEENPKITTIMGYVVDDIFGDTKVKGVTLSGRKTPPTIKNPYGTESEIIMGADGVFIYVGLDPITKPFEDLGILNEKGYIVTDEKLETSIKGLFAVGDVREKTVRQVATAVGDGAIVGVEVNKYLEEL